MTRVRIGNGDHKNTACGSHIDSRRWYPNVLARQMPTRCQDWDKSMPGEFWIVLRVTYVLNKANKPWTGQETTPGKNGLLEAEPQRPTALRPKKGILRTRDL